MATKFKIGYELPGDSAFDNYYLDYERTILERTFETQVMPKNLFLMSFFGNSFDERDDEVSKIFTDYGIHSGVDGSEKVLPMDNQFAHLIDTVEVDENSLYDNLAFKSEELPVLTFNVTDDISRTFGGFYKRFFKLWLNENLSYRRPFVPHSYIVKTSIPINTFFDDFTAAIGYVNSLNEKFSTFAEIGRNALINPKKADGKEKTKKEMNEEVEEFLSKKEIDSKKYKSQKLDFMKKAAFVSDRAEKTSEKIPDSTVNDLIECIGAMHPGLFTNEGINDKIAGDNKEFYSAIKDLKNISKLKDVYDKHAHKDKYQVVLDLLDAVVKLNDDGLKWNNGDNWSDFFDKLQAVKDIKSADYNEVTSETFDDSFMRTIPFLNLSVTQYAYDSKMSAVKTRPLVTYTFYNLRPCLDLKKIPKNLLQLGDGFNYENTTKGEKYEFSFSGITMYDHTNDIEVLSLGNCLKKD